jgi:hypothetical protein
MNIAIGKDRLFVRPGIVPAFLEMIWFQLILLQLMVLTAICMCIAKQIVVQNAVQALKEDVQQIQFVAAHGATHGVMRT